MFWLLVSERISFERYRSSKVFVMNSAVAISENISSPERKELLTIWKVYAEPKQNGFRLRTCKYKVYSWLTGDVTKEENMESEMTFDFASESIKSKIEIYRSKNEINIQRPKCRFSSGKKTRISEIKPLPIPPNHTWSRTHRLLMTLLENRTKNQFKLKDFKLK